MKSFRKFSALVAVSLAFGLVGGCGSGSSGGNSGPDQPAAAGPQAVVDDLEQAVEEVFEPGPMAPEDVLVGISMPSRTLERWNSDGEHLDELLREQGFQTDLEFADNRVDQQISQVQTMIDNGALVLVVAAIDGSALGPVLADAAEHGIRIIAYDRLIRDTANLDYYVTFDNEQVGKMQADYIIDGLGLDRGNDGPYNIELFAGAAEESNSRYFFCSAFNELKPYFDDGALVSPSGKVPASCDEFDDIAVAGWTSENAQTEMADRLHEFYSGDKHVDAVLSPNDSIALGITQALKADGYNANNFPILTGQDADVANVQNMIDGTQSMTVFKDTRVLGDQVATMIAQMARGDTVAINDTETYDNGVKIVPTYLLPPQLVVRDDIQSALIDSGFIPADAVHGLDD